MNASTLPEPPLPIGRRASEDIVAVAAKPTAAPVTFRPGDRVRVRTEAEILATLDAEGKLDGLPFMPEMLRFSGKPAIVYRRAERTCDTVEFQAQRRMRHAVHLVGLRCDGSAHGGCDAGCLLFWKEAWLERDPTPPTGPSRESPAPDTVPAEPMPPGSTITERDLVAVARLRGDASSDTERYMCQATEVVRASTPVQWWEPTQYVRDVTSGNASALAVAAGLAKWLFVVVQKRFVNGSSVPFVKGRLRKTPRQTLDLRPGELVRVKSRREIERTLDRNNRNRGLSFDSEALRYCGKEFRVLRRVRRIIDERSGHPIELASDCIILDTVACTSEYHRLCPRSVYLYWREIWLERVVGEAEPTVPASEPEAEG